MIYIDLMTKSVLVVLVQPWWGSEDLCYHSHLVKGSTEKSPFFAETESALSNSPSIFPLFSQGGGWASWLWLKNSVIKRVCLILISKLAAVTPWHLGPGSLRGRTATSCNGKFYNGSAQLAKKEIKVFRTLTWGHNSCLSNGNRQLWNLEILVSTVLLTSWHRGAWEQSSVESTV